MMTVCEDKYADVQMMIIEARHDEAMAALQQLVAEHDDFAIAHNDLGSLYYHAGQMDQALAHFQKAANWDPDNPEYLKNLADILYKETGDAERALANYDKILFIRPDDVDTLMVAGHIGVSLERFDEALGHYTRILEIEPSNEDAKQYVDRIKCQKDVQENEPGPETAYKNCQVLVSQGHFDEGIACLERLTQQHPGFALAHNDLGVLYYRMGKKKRSVQCYEQAVSIEPDNPNFRKNLADYYLVEQGWMEEAMEIYLSVLNDNPEDIDVLMVAGHVCFALGKKTSAKTFYERVVDLEPWNFDANDRLEKLNMI